MQQWAGKHSVGSIALPRGPDTLAAAITLGERTVPGGFASWTALALLAHGVLLAWALGLIMMREMASLIHEMRAMQRDALHIEYLDIDVEKKPPPVAPPPLPPEPIPEPAAAPLPTPKAAAPPKDDPYDPPPAVAQATKVLTAPDDDPVDLTGQGFVSGDGTGPGYGQVSAAGTGTVATMNPNARIGGVVGGTGTGAPTAPPPPPSVDRSKPPGLTGGSAWNCSFPPEADTEQIDSAVAVVVVTVRPDGTPMSVKVVTDPGHGFGRAARTCALGRRYTPGLDRDGQPTISSSPPIRVNFTR